MRGVAHLISFWVFILSIISLNFIKFILLKIYLIDNFKMANEMNSVCTRH